MGGVPRPRLPQAAPGDARRSARRGLRHARGPGGRARSLDFLGATLAEIDDTAGDIDTLTGRIAAIRTWTYISHQARWLKGATDWQERTRAIEDRLSDALHERLVQRFVERAGGKRAPAARPRSRAAPAAPERDAPRDHPFARLQALRATLAPLPAGPGRDDDAWIEDAIAAPHESFTLDAGGRIAWGDRPLGQLARGTALLLPEVRLAGLDDLGPGARSRILRRLLAFARDLDRGAARPPPRARATRARPRRGEASSTSSSRGWARRSRSARASSSPACRRAIARSSVRRA